MTKFIAFLKQLGSLIADAIAYLKANVHVSKTSINGMLAFGIAACTALLTQPNLVSPKVVGALTIVLGLCRWGVGFLQTDADSVKVQLPSGTDGVVPAHPTPDDPTLAGKVITPASK